MLNEIKVEKIIFISGKGIFINGFVVIVHFERATIFELGLHKNAY